MDVSGSSRERLWIQDSERVESRTTSRRDRDRDSVTSLRAKRSISVRERVKVFERNENREIFERNEDRGSLRAKRSISVRECQSLRAKQSISVRERELKFSSETKTEKSSSETKRQCERELKFSSETKTE